MLRNVIIEKRCEHQWQNWQSNGQNIYGIVFGLPATTIGGTDYIVHLAPTPSSTEEQSVALTSSELSNQTVVPNFGDILEHALNALRMLPGNCQVLGLFTIEQTLSDIKSPEFLQYVKVLRQLDKELHKLCRIYAACNMTMDGSGCDKFILNIAGKGITVPRCTNILINNQASSSSFVPLKLHVESKPIKWVSFYAQFDDTYEYCLERDSNGMVSVERNVSTCVRTLELRLSQCKVFVDGDPLHEHPVSRGSQMTIANYLKTRKNNSLQVRMRLYFEIAEPNINESGVVECTPTGLGKCMGEVSSIVFAHPQQSIGIVETYLKCDLLRSIACRLRLYLDANPVAHESRAVQLPRRVFFWPFPGDKIAFGDYVFAEESTHVVAENASVLLGLSVNNCTMNASREHVQCTNEKSVHCNAITESNRRMQNGRYSSTIIALWSLSIIILGMGLRMYLTIPSEEKLINRHRI